MMIKKTLCLAVIFAFSSSSFSEVVGIDEGSIDRKMDEFATLTDYYNAQIKMLDAKKKAEDAKEGKAVVNSQSEDVGVDSFQRESLLNRSKRGRYEYDPKGEEDTQKDVSTAYVSSTYGSSKLNAEIQWGEMSFIVEKGDHIVGGSWTVESISKGAVVLTDGRRQIRMTGSPVLISQLVGGES